VQLLSICKDDIFHQRYFLIRLALRLSCCSFPVATVYTKAFRVRIR
jgi:hypothetical protein